MNIEFNQEFSLGSERYRYDFELPDLKVMIEADGIQHFTIGGYNPTHKRLAISQLKDVLKMAQANVAGYKVIRIDYTWYGRPVEDFVKFLKGLLVETPWDELPNYTYSTPSMYDWVSPLLPAVFHE